MTDDYKFDIRKRYPLDGVGTRWEHYSELVDIFGDGLIALGKLQYQTEIDRRKIEQLKAAVELIQIRLDLLARFEDANFYRSSFDNMFRNIEEARKAGTLDGYKPIPLLTEGTSEQAKDSGFSSDTQSEKIPPQEPAGV